jgi:prepilin-type processing-associated H-X9-DG protein
MAQHQEHRTRFQFTLRSMLTATTLLAMLLGFAMWILRSRVKELGVHGCKRDLEYIGEGLRRYEDQYGHLPRAAEYDASGQPMHSWRSRVCLLFEEFNGYDWPYRWNEAWNSPYNRTLQDSFVSSAFRCPAERPRQPPTANYVAVVGPGTVWPQAAPGRTKDLSTGKSGAALLVEVAPSDIHWMEPRDLDVSAFDCTINGTSGGGSTSSHPGGANVLLCDGSVRFLSAKTSPEVVRALVTPAAGKGCPSDSTRGSPPQENQPLRPPAR